MMLLAYNSFEFSSKLLDWVCLEDFKILISSALPFWLYDESLFLLI